MSFIEELNLSKETKNLLKNRKKVKKLIREGKTLQEIMQLSDKGIEDLYKAAYKLFENGHYFDAANAFLFLVTLNPNIAKYWIGLGMSLQMIEEYEAAIDAYEMAAMYEIENPVPYFYLAKCLFSLHERESTLQALDLAIEYAGDYEEYKELKKQAMKVKKMIEKG